MTAETGIDVFSGLDAVEAYIETGSGREKAREGIAEARRVIELCASDTTAVDLRQEIEFMKAERPMIGLSREDVGLAIDAVAMLVRPHVESEYRRLLHRLQDAYRKSLVVPE